MLDNNMENATFIGNVQIHLVSQDNISHIFQQLKSNNPKYKSLDFSKITLSQMQLLELEYAIKDNSHIGYIKFGNLTQDIQNLIANINKKIADNNNLLKEYPSDYIHALISQNVYQDIKEGQTRNFNGESWRVIKVLKNDKCNYFGAIYQNTYTGSLVLAHRGTVINIYNALKKGMAHADIRGVFQGQIVEPQFYNWLLTCEAVELAKEGGHHLSVTGHSLGAWHAELSVYFAHKDFNYHKLSCVNFDSPGTYTTLKNMKSNIRNHSNIDLDNLDITTYNSHPNIVNSCNKHVGRVFQLKTNFNKISFLERFGSVIADARILADIQSHSLDCILAEFDSTTGEPKLGKVDEMKDWPYIAYKYDKSQNNKFLYNLSDRVTSAISNAALLLPAGALAKAAIYAGGKLAQTVANSIINASDTSLQSIMDILAAYCYKKIDLNQLKELYLNDITKKQDLVEQTVKKINTDNIKGFGIKNFNLEYKAHRSQLKREEGHLVFKGHLLVKLDKYRRHAELYPITNDTKNHYGITDELITQLSDITNRCKVASRAYHHGKVEYTILTEPHIDLRYISRRLQKLYDVNPVVRTVADNKDLIHRNISWNIRAQEKKQEYIDKAQKRYISLSQDEKQVIHHIFYSYPIRLLYEIFDNGCEHIIKKLQNKHLIGLDDALDEVFITDEIYNELSHKIKIENIKIDSLKFLINQYNNLFVFVSCDRDKTLKNNETFLTSYIASKIYKILEDEVFEGDKTPQSLQDRNSFLLSFKFANYQFREENPNIAHIFYEDAFEFNNVDQIIEQLSNEEFNYAKESLKYLTEHSCEDRYCADYDKWLARIEKIKGKSKSNNVQQNHTYSLKDDLSSNVIDLVISERTAQQNLSFIERENLRSTDQSNHQPQL